MTMPFKSCQIKTMPFVNKFNTRAVVVGQLADGLLPTPEICTLNPVISKMSYPQSKYLLLTVEKIKLKNRFWQYLYIELI